MLVRDVSQFSEGLVETWTGPQSLFVMVGVFSGVVENLTHRAVEIDQ